MVVLPVYSTYCNHVLRKRSTGKRFLTSLLAFLIAARCIGTSIADDTNSGGKRIYDYYCYQCHGYAGNGVTLAANYLDPPPRNFTVTSLEELTREQMFKTIYQGKPGTAMSAFGNTLSRDEIESVVAYVRNAFMSGSDQDYRYHTEQNGWSRHERYRAAFPYIFGKISIGDDENSLTVDERAGKHLFLSACISCHEPPANPQTSRWELRGVSYPPGNYTENNEPPVYELHEQAPVLINATAQEARGELLYQRHCAHCHAEDGTGRNWIGSFLTPHPPDFTNQLFKTRVNYQRLYDTIANGINGTSMPAWKSVLPDDDINATIAYMKHVFGPFVDQRISTRNSHHLPPSPSWVKNDAVY